MGLFSGNSKKPAVPKVKKQRASTVQQTIPYLKVFDNGMFLNAPGIYSKTYSFADMNFETEEEEEQDNIMREFKKALNKFGPNVTVQYNIVNSQVPVDTLEQDYFINAKSSDIPSYTDTEEETKRKESIQIYREEYNGIISEKIREGRNDIRKTRYITLSIEAPDVLMANRTFDTLELGLQEVFTNVNGEGVHPLTIEERLCLFRSIFHSGDGINFEKILNKYRNKEGEFKLSKMASKGISTKDLIAPAYLINGAQQIAVGENLFAKSYILVDLPTSMESNLLSEITNIPCVMITSVIHKTKPKKKALKEVKIHNNGIKSEVVKANQNAYKNNYDPSLISEELTDAREEGSFLVKDLTINNQKLFYSTITVTIFAHTLEDLKEFGENLAMKVSDYQCQVDPLYGQQMLGLKNALPLAVNHLSMDRMLTTEAASAFFPFSVQELMDKNGHFYGLNAITKNMIIYNRRDSELANGLVFGKSGSGKSFIIKGEIIPNLLDYDDDIIILDPDAEYLHIADQFGGTVVDVSQKSEFYINPLDLNMDYNGEGKNDPISDKADYLVSLIESILPQTEGVTPFEINVIQRCCRRMYKEYEAHMEKLKEECELTGKELIFCDPEACPTLVDFYQELIDDNSQEGHHLAMALEPYCLGDYNVFAHRTNLKSKPRFLVYNLKNMPNKMKEMAMKVCLSDIWNRVLCNKDEKKATWVYLDEFYLLCRTEGAATTLQEYYKRIRKYYGIMTGITQDIEDVLVTPQGRGMLSNSGFFIMMKQSKNGQLELQNQFGISNALLEYIKDKPAGIGLIYNNRSLIPFNYRLPTDTALYKLMSTKPSEDR